jgi:hypothetical protein
LRSPPTYPDGLVGRNVNVNAAAAAASTNDSYPIGGSGDATALGLAYGDAAGGIASNTTQTVEGEQVCKSA